MVWRFAQLVSEMKTNDRDILIFMGLPYMGATSTSALIGDKRNRLLSYVSRLLVYSRRTRSEPHQRTALTEGPLGQGWRRSAPEPGAGDGRRRGTSAMGDALRIAARIKEYSSALVSIPARSLASMVETIAGSISRYDVLGDISHAASLALRIDRMKWRPQGAAEWFRRAAPRRRLIALPRRPEN